MMALVKCGECGREISDRAESCPGCGMPMQAAKPPPLPKQQSWFTPSPGARGCLAVVFVLVLLGALGSIIDSCSEQAGPTAPRRPQTTPSDSTQGHLR